MTDVKLYSGETIPLEMHKAKIIQKLNLAPIEHRHVWQAFPFLPESGEALQKAAAFLKKQIPDSEQLLPYESSQDKKRIDHG
jgi:hypothetical protein